MKNLDSIYCAARDLPPEDRAAWLAQACGEDGSLRGRVEEMLAVADKAEAFIACPNTSDPTLFTASPEQPGSSIGPYKLREQIGEGGFGTVWVADQEHPVRRRVALKIIKAGMDTKEVIARFEQERQALAVMDHPNIAKVLDAGTTDQGRPYFVMELVRGVKITDFCDEQQLSMEERIALFITVCQAVQHAHQKGIIHRDLKPSNILVSLNDGVAVPKVIDFGVAKATQGRLADGTIYTKFEQMIGTPLYMSPEQAQMTSVDIDTRSDIYALGVLLYELLTGRTPIDQDTLRHAGMDEMRRLIREVDPPRPSARVKSLCGEEMTTAAKRRHTEPAKFSGALRGDLDWIVMKCIEKDRKRRYDTANGLALDLQRHLANEVVTARPPTAGYLLSKLIRRHRIAFAAGTAIAASLVIGVTAATVMYFREREARKQTAAERDAKEAAREEAEAISTFLTEVFQSPAPERDGYTITVAETLDRAAQRLDTDLAGQPARRAKLQLTLGQTYRALSLYRESLPLQEKARDYYLATFGPEHQATLDAKHFLAHSYRAVGRKAEALKLLEEIVPVRLKLQGPEDPRTLHYMSCLAISYVETRRYTEALKLLEKVLPLMRKVDGPEHDNTLTAMNNLAFSYAEAGRQDEALKMREEVLAVRRRVCGQRHPDTLTSMSNLARSYFDGGRRDEALKIREEVLAVRRKLNGPENSETLLAMHQLAKSWFEAGRRDEALKLREETLALGRKVDGPEHENTLAAMLDLAKSCDDAGRREEALKLHEEALPLSRKVYGPEHQTILTRMNVLGDAYAAAGRDDEALKLREEALTFSRKLFGPESIDTHTAIVSLAESYTATGRREEALKLQEEALPLSRKVYGPEHPTTLGGMTNLAVCYARAGRLPEAVALQEQSLAIKRRVLPPSDPYFAAALGNMVRLCELTGRKDEALKLRAELASLKTDSDFFPPVAATLIPPDSEWKWLHPTDGVDPAGKDADFHTTFFAGDYDDSAWKSGKDSDSANGGFGYGSRFTGVDIGLPPDETHRHTAYFRLRFTTDKPHRRLELRCLRDDALIVYLDGKEVLRDNLPGSPEAYLLSATQPQGPDNDRIAHRFSIPGTLAPGEHLLAISLHNTELPSSDLYIGGITLVETAEETKPPQ